MQFMRHFGRLIPSDPPAEIALTKRRGFPFVKKLEDGAVWIIGLDTTTRVPAKVVGFNALGNVGERQLGRLRKVLAAPALKDARKLVVMHHHPMIVPFHNWGDSLKALRSSQKLMTLLYAERVDMVLHGHKHSPFCWQSHAFDQHNMAVICAGPPNAYARDAQWSQQTLIYNIYCIRGDEIAIIHKACVADTGPKASIFVHGQ